MVICNLDFFLKISSFFFIKIYCICIKNEENKFYLKCIEIDRFDER